MKKFLSILICISCLFSTNAFANSSLSSSAGSAVAGLYAGTGKISKEQYDAFWDKVGVKSRSEKEQVIGFMRDNFLLIQDYQIQVWKCAEQAWTARKVPTCNKMRTKLGQVQANFKKVGQEDSLTRLTRSSDSVINAAATHGKFTMSNGHEGQMSLELIQSTGASLDALFSRFEQVLKVEY